MYKYTRKEIVDAWLKYRNIEGDFGRNLKDDLLAQKEDKKECKHNWKLTPDTWGETCFYCGKQRKIKTTPSPLEIEEVSELMDFGFNEAVTIRVKLINRIIRNQNLIIKQLKQL